VGWDSSVGIVETHSRHQPVATWVNTTRYCKYSQVPLIDGRKHRPKHVELTWNNKLIYIVYLVGYFHSCHTLVLSANFRCKKKFGTWTTTKRINRFLL